MTREHFERLHELFFEARRRAPASRAAFLREACGGDAKLLAQLESMLAQDDAPAVDLEAPLLGDNVKLSDLVAPERAPERIGAYAIEGILGRGGMGVVYRARQSRPDRVVALKVIRPGALSQGTMRRFEHEVRLLGRLTHPGIAQIHEAGTADDGEGAQPYFAMELVEGLPLLDYAAREGLDVRARLRLMAKVSDAVQHAHLKGVIHRDLKPANILVRDGQPKILDFGVARATDADLQAATVAASAGELIGTLSYMSPEQMTGEAEALDTRSDVYALGVVLYELLAGEVPHALSRKPLTEVIRIVREEDARPLRVLDARFRGDVDVIVGKALERDRERRYQSAGALGDDLRATLDHRPIEASHPGPVVRLRKWTRRNPTLTTAAVVVVVVGVLLAAWSTAAAWRARVEAASVLADAGRAVVAYRAERASVAARAIESAEIERARFVYTTAAEDRALDRRELAIVRGRRQHRERFDAAIDLINLADRLAADPAGVRSARARLYLARYLESKDQRDEAQQGRYLDLVRRYDPDGAFEPELAPSGTVTLTSVPPGARVHLFRMRRLSELVDEGEPRLVPVPIGEENVPLLAGAWALRVVESSGGVKAPVEAGLDAGDLIVEVAGRPVRDTVLVARAREPVRRFDRLVSIEGMPVRGAYEIESLGEAATEPEGGVRTKRFEFERDDRVFAVTGASLEALGVVAIEARSLVERGDVPVRVWRQGEIVEMHLGMGVPVRTTAIPLFLSGDAVAGSTPVSNLELEEGQYLAVLSAPGYEDLRYPFQVSEGARTLAPARLAPARTMPAGYVHVFDWTDRGIGSFWIKEREVTVREYFDFLDDPDVGAVIDASPEPILVPYGSAGVYTQRGDDGRFVLPDGWRWDWPVLGVTWRDAAAFAEWKTARARERGLDHVYDLPTADEWLLAGGALDGFGDGHLHLRRFTFGNEFRAAWASSLLARRVAYPEPVLRFPVDESVFGVFDMAGSMSEWLDAYWYGGQQRRVVGGSWAHGGPDYIEMFALDGYSNRSERGRGDTISFRLVLRTNE